MDFIFKNSILPPPIEHLGAGTGKPDRPRLSGATPSSPTFIDSRSGELETATAINNTNITTKCLNSNMSNDNGEDSAMEENTPTKSFASTPDLGEDDAPRRLTKYLTFPTSKVKIVLSLCGAHRDNSLLSLLPKLHLDSISTPGSEGGSGSDTPNTWEELANLPEEEENAILSSPTPLGAVRSTDQTSAEEGTEPTTVVKSAPPSPTSSTTSRQSSVGSAVRRNLKHQLTITESLEKGRERWRLANKERSKGERDQQRNIFADTSASDHLLDSSPSPVPIPPPTQSEELDAARALPELPPPAPVESTQGELESPETASSPVQPEAAETPATNTNAGGEFAAAGRKGKARNPDKAQPPNKKKRSRGGKKKNKKKPLDSGAAQTEGDGGRSSGGGNLNPVERLFDKGEPAATITITRQGEGGDAHDAVARALLLAPEYFHILNLRPTTDGAIIEVTDQETAMRIVQTHLGNQGWTIALQPIWARYSFVAPGQLAGHSPGQGVDPSTIVRSLSLRNTALFGLPPNSVRFVSHAWETVEGEGEGSTGTVRHRLRIWVDISPEGEAFFARREYMMPTLVGAVRLRPAPRSRPRPNRS